MHSLRRVSATVSRFCKNHLNRSLTSKPANNTETEEQKEKSILVEKIEGITTIGINRPEKKNCLDIATIHELVEELEKFENDKETYSGVIHGIGGNFSSGYDLKEIADYNEKSEQLLPQFGPLADRVEQIKKPLVAAISGYALGVGFELALLCDVRLMDENAVMGFLNRRFGIPILCGGTVRLPAMIGYSRAMEMIISGRAISAEEAFNWGLVTTVTSTGTVLGTAANYAKSLVKFPQNALLADRTSAHYATFSAKQIEEALQFEKDNASHLLYEDGVIGAKRFVTDKVGRHGKFYNLTERNFTFRELDKDLL